MIERRVLADHHDRLIAIISEVHRVTGLIVITSFVGYGLAVYIWYRGYIWWALITATLAYVLFRAFRPLSLFAARRQLGSQDGFAATFAVLDSQMAHRPSREVLSEIERLVEETRQARH